MKKLHILLSIVCLSLLTSCLKDQENLFDKSSDQRAEEAIAADYKLLAGAEHGWLMQYFPSPYRTYGGYNIIMKFTADGQVTIASENDIIETASGVPGGFYHEANSYYKITQSAGIVLSFDTYNEVFHLFSTPDAPIGGETGKGLEGDYDFEFITTSPDKIVLKGKKTSNYAVLTPMPDDNWEGYFDNISKTKNQIVFNTAIGNIDNKEYTMTIWHNDRWVEIETADTLLEAPFCYNTDGIILYEPLEVGSKKIQTLKYDGETGVLYAAEDAATKFDGQIIPAIVINNVGASIASDNNANTLEYFFNFADRFTYTPTVDWITASINGNKLTINIAANNTGNMRAGGLIVENNGMKEMIMISQMEVSDLIGNYALSCLDSDGVAYNAAAMVSKAQTGENDYILTFNYPNRNYPQSFQMTWNAAETRFEFKSGQTLGTIGQYVSFLCFIDAKFNYWTSTSTSYTGYLYPSLNSDGIAELTVGGAFGTNPIGGLCILVGNNSDITQMLGYYDYFTNILFTKQ